MDTVLCMGQRNAARACQRATSAIAWIHGNRGFSIENYLDDLIGVETVDCAQLSFDELGTLLYKLGLLEKGSKACPPATKQMVLGIEIDTVLQTLRVDDERMRDIIDELRKWGSKSKASLKELQSLIGKLAFIAKCVSSSRVFMNRLIHALKAANKHNDI